jgi:hypothetical protein
MRVICFITAFLAAYPLEAQPPEPPATQPELPAVVGTYQQELSTFYSTADGLPSDDVRLIAIDHGQVAARTAKGDVFFTDDQWTTAIRPPVFVFDAEIEAGPTGLKIDGSEQFPSHGSRRWAPTNVNVARDGLGRLWFCSDQGVGCLHNDKWTLYTGADGLPYDDFTCIAAGPDGTMWFGTSKGVIRFDGGHWAYRQGKRWLPEDHVRDIAVDAEGNAWIATQGGVAKIHFREMTLADKAAFFESEIDQHHRRTKFGFVIEAHAANPGDKSKLTRSTSDNDGLWTSMYGAGECFAYGATKDPQAKRRANAAFEALKFLSEAPKGSPHEPPAGFIARTVLETSSPRDPNTGSYTLAGQREMQKRDRQWRVYEPRWPKSGDGQWYWKSDTSSDELDGHYFFYALYYDLVAETEQQKADVRDVVRANVDHLISHDFSMHDHAGRTRWAMYTPEELNKNPKWFVERGLNSVSMLSYLNVAFHITGDQKYRDTAKQLRDKHAFHINAMSPKYQFGIGSGNQSDDEMAFMAFYNLIRFEPDLELRNLYLLAFANYWRLEEPELNPFFNFCFAAVAMNQQRADNWGVTRLSPWPSWLNDSVETLKKFPLDRFDWAHTNNHRTDLIMLTRHAAQSFSRRNSGRGYRVNGKVIPVDERHFNHWNHDPWRLNTGGAGHGLADGAVFTLPYYMGLYHGFIAPDR